MWEAPAANTWDLEQVTYAALAVLRLENDDVDKELVASSAQEATQLIDIELDLQPVVVPALPFDAGAVPTLVRAASRLAVDLYRGTPHLNERGEPDPAGAVRAEVAPFKLRWGVA